MQPIEVLVHLAEVGTPPEGDAVLRVSAGLRETLDRIAVETFPFVESGGAELQFVHAPYGRGKTHFLKALQQRAREHGFVTVYVDCQDGNSPFKSLIETYRAITRGMVPPGKYRSSGTSGIAKVIEARFDGMNCEAQRALIDALKADRSLVPDYRNLVTSYFDSTSTSERDEELAELIEALLAATPSYRVTLGELYRKYKSLPRPLGKLGRRNAAVWLRCALSLPRALGYPGMVLLFDETEQALGGRSPRQRMQHLAHIRTFVDHMAVGAFRGCAVYYTVVESFIEIAHDHLAALSQRIERKRVPGIGDGRNPRAIWVDLDELTVPGTGDKRFFEELAERIVDLGVEAGLNQSATGPMLKRFLPLAREFAEENIHEGRVREYVKVVSEQVAKEVDEHEC